MTDPRERRRQRANQSSEKADPLAVLKKFRGAMIIVVLWAAIIGFNYAQAVGVIGDPGDDCPGHWHSTASVWVGENMVPFNPNAPSLSDPTVTASSTSSPGAGFHIHPDNPQILHFHPGAKRCIELDGAMNKLGFEVKSDSLVVGPAHPGAGTYQTNDTHELVIYHQPYEKSWRQVSNVGSFMDRQLGDGDKVMIGFFEKGNEAMVQNAMEGTPDLSDNYTPPDERFGDDFFVTVMSITVIAGVALWLWYSFAKKAW